METETKQTLKKHNQGAAEMAQQLRALLLLRIQFQALIQWLIRARDPLLASLGTQQVHDTHIFIETTIHIHKLKINIVSLKKSTSNGRQFAFQPDRNFEDGIYRYQQNPLL